MVCLAGEPGHGTMDSAFMVNAGSEFVLMDATLKLDWHRDKMLTWQFASLASLHVRARHRPVGEPR